MHGCRLATGGFNHVESQDHAGAGAFPRSAHKPPTAAAGFLGMGVGQVDVIPPIDRKHLKRFGALFRAPFYSDKRSSDLYVRGAAPAAMTG